MEARRGIERHVGEKGNGVRNVVSPCSQFRENLHLAFLLSYREKNQSNKHKIQFTKIVLLHIKSRAKVNGRTIPCSKLAGGSQHDSLQSICVMRKV